LNSEFCFVIGASNSGIKLDRVASLLKILMTEWMPAASALLQEDIASKKLYVGNINSDLLEC